MSTASRVLKALVQEVGGGEDLELDGRDERGDGEGREVELENRGWNRGPCDNLPRKVAAREPIHAAPPPAKRLVKSTLFLGYVNSRRLVPRWAEW